MQIETQLKPMDNFNSPVWGIIQTINTINRNLAENFINYNEWTILMTNCSNILKRIKKDDI